MQAKLQRKNRFPTTRPKNIFSGGLPGPKKRKKRLPLDNNVNNAAKPVNTGISERDVDLYKLRDNAANLLPRMGVNRCGKVPISDYVTVDQNSEGITRFGHVAHCGSIWVCPVCAYKKLRRRQEEIKNILKVHNDSGCTFSFLTLTVRHHLHQPLTVLINSLQSAWRQITKERKLKPLFQNSNFIQTLEIRYSENTGWHPHYHCVFMFTPAEQNKALLRVLIESWLDKTDSLAEGQKVIDASGEETLSEYLAKMGLAQELTGGPGKNGKSMSYFDLLKDPIRWKKLIEEYSAATKHVRSMRKSKGLNIADDDDDVNDEVVVNLLNIKKSVFQETIVKNCHYKLILENVTSCEFLKEYFRNYEIDFQTKTVFNRRI